MKSLKTILKNLIADESGEDLIEYALIAAVIAVIAVISLRTFSASISSTCTTINNALTTNV